MGLGYPTGLTRYILRVSLCHLPSAQVHIAHHTRVIVPQLSSGIPGQVPGSFHNPPQTTDFLFPCGRTSVQHDTIAHAHDMGADPNKERTFGVGTHELA
jgi:hypothetical protein